MPQEDDNYDSYMHLYRALCNKPYKQSSFWSNKRDFVPDPILTEKKFIEDTAFLIIPSTDNR